VERDFGVVEVSLLSVLALAVEGFHPYAEDGGLYVAGIKKVLDPGLYAARPEFVLAHLRFSPFAPFMAGVVQLTHVRLEWALLALYCGSMWATLYAGWMVASRCGATKAGRCGAVALLACWMTMPIAGTSLMLMDPYVTARSVSTPLVLLALAWAMDAVRGSRRGGWLCALALGLAAIHPLMAGYGLAMVAVMAVVGSGHARVRRWGPVVLCALAVVAAAGVQAWAPAESGDYARAAMTRYYWFPLRWDWYEQFGLVAPLVLLWVMARSMKPKLEAVREWSLLARTATLLGGIALVVALLFARTGMATHLVARLQPLRCFQMVYEVLFLALGAWVGEGWLARHAWRWGVMLAMLGGVMFGVQRGTYPWSAHFEEPWRAPHNAWEQTFVWVRQNTRRDAVFALDAHYITRAGEDAQGFRAIAERSVLPDYSKDGGEASISPQLASAWAAGVEAQTGLDTENDAERARKLKPLGVDWVVLPQTSATRWTCPYDNGDVKVCRIG
jgi:hypothetical protein